MKQVLLALTVLIAITACTQPQTASGPDLPTNDTNDTADAPGPGQAPIREGQNQTYSSFSQGTLTAPNYADISYDLAQSQTSIQYHVNSTVPNPAYSYESIAQINEADTALIITVNTSTRSGVVAPHVISQASTNGTIDAETSPDHIVIRLQNNPLTAPEYRGNLSWATQY